MPFFQSKHSNISKEMVGKSINTVNQFQEPTKLVNVFHRKIDLISIRILTRIVPIFSSAVIQFKNMHNITANQETCPPFPTTFHAIYIHLKSRQFSIWVVEVKIEVTQNEGLNEGIACCEKRVGTSFLVILQQLQLCKQYIQN